jgi:hypothetical protein
MAEALKPINGGGLQLYPFNAFKRWVVTNSNYRDDYYQISILKGISPLHNEKVLLSSSLNNELVADATQLDNSNSGNTPFLASKEQKVIWSGLNQMFFKHRVNNERDLYASASIFSIPQNRLGDGIKPNSITISDNSNFDFSIFTLNIDDRKIDEYHGYLYDTNLTINTSSYVPFGDLIGYWGFDDEIVPRITSYDDIILDRSGYTSHAVGRNLKYEPGILTTGALQLHSGTKVTLDGNTSYVKIKNKQKLSPVKANDYSISLWTVLPLSQSDTSRDYNWIVNKNGSYFEEYIDNIGKTQTRYRNEESPIYPYDIKIYNQNTSENGKLSISISDGIRITHTTSSTYLNNGQHHIIFNKTGSLLELWVDGIKESSASLNLKSDIWNEYDVLLGSHYISDLNKYGSIVSGDVTSNFSTLSGSIDEVRFYRRALTSTEIQHLSNNDYLTGSAYQSDIVGEVFYNQGIMVVSDPRPKYKNVWLGQGNWNYNSSTYGWTTKYKSTKKLYETSVLCEIGSAEFNMSTNPTLRKNNDIREPFFKPFVTGSSFAPYFTSIGLYNKAGELLAVGKLGSAIQTRNDVDITVKVRFDLDGAFGTPTLPEQLHEEDKPTLKERQDGKFVWNSKGF